MDPNGPHVYLVGVQTYLRDPTWLPQEGQRELPADVSSRAGDQNAHAFDSSPMAQQSIEMPHHVTNSNFVGETLTLWLTPSYRRRLSQQTLSVL